MKKIINILIPFIVINLFIFNLLYANESNINKPEIRVKSLLMKDIIISKYKLKHLNNKWITYIKNIDRIFNMIEQKWDKERFKQVSNRLSEYIKNKSSENLLTFNRLNPQLVYLNAKINYKIYSWNFIVKSKELKQVIKKTKIINKDSYSRNKRRWWSSTHLSDIKSAAVVEKKILKKVNNCNEILKKSGWISINWVYKIYKNSVDWYDTYCDMDNIRKIQKINKINKCDYYVSTRWNDSNNWKNITTPFLTFEKARDSIRSFRINNSIPTWWLVVCIRWWKYFRTKSFELTAEDSWEESKRIIYKSYNNEKVRIIWWKEVSWNLFNLVNSTSKIWDRLDNSAKWNLFSIDLWLNDINDYWIMKDAIKYSWLQLFVNNKPMTLSRRPDKDYSIFSKQQSYNDDNIIIYWTSKLAWNFSKYWILDNVNSYKKDKLIDWKQYFLYRHTWEYQNKTYTAWFVSTDYGKYPSTKNQKLFSYSKTLSNITFRVWNWAIWTATTRDTNFEEINHWFSYINDVVSDTQFTYIWDRAKRWAKADDLWFHWYWWNTRYDNHIKSKNIDLLNNLITLTKRPTYWLKKWLYYYAENLVEEITEPWERYLDRTSWILYFWPKDEIKKSEIILSMMNTSLLNINNASNILFDNIIFEEWRADWIIITWDNNTISNSIIRNLWTNWIIIKWYNNNITYSKIYNTWYTWIIINWISSDFNKLKPSNNVIDNNDISISGMWRWTYEPWVKINYWVWNIIKNNDIHNSAHIAISYIGNNNIIEYNNIYDTNKFSSDAWAIYSWRSWNYRGNILRYNYIHDVQSYFKWYWVQWIYLDDMLSWETVQSNIFYNIASNWIKIGWWRDNIVDSNVFVKTDWYYIWCYAINAINHELWSSWDFLWKMNKYDYKNWIWADTYPLLKIIPNIWTTIVNDKYESSMYIPWTPEKNKVSRWFLPESSTFTNNIWYNNKTFFREKCPVKVDKIFKKISNNFEKTNLNYDNKTILENTLRHNWNIGWLKWFNKYFFENIWVQNY